MDAIKAHVASDSAANGLRPRARGSRPVNSSEETVRLAPGELLSAVELADLLGLQPATVHEWARRGVLPSFKPGKRRYFVRADVEAALSRFRDDALNVNPYRSR
jgi:excisionase family DNA binding protein